MKLRQARKIFLSGHGAAVMMPDGKKSWCGVPGDRHTFQQYIRAENRFFSALNRRRKSHQESEAK